MDSGELQWLRGSCRRLRRADPEHLDTFVDEQRYLFHVWNGQPEAQTLWVAFCVDSLTFPGNPFNIGINQLTVEWQ
jgi:hypothetical protein